MTNVSNPRSTGSSPLSEVAELARFARATVTLALCLLFLRQVLLPEDGIFGAFQAGSLRSLWGPFVIGLAFLIALSTRFSLRPGWLLAGLLAGLLALLAWRALVLIVGGWHTGIEVWWLLPILSVTLPLPLACLDLMDPRSRQGSPWRFSPVQWGIVGLYIGLLAAVCWASWNGPGREPREAIQMLRGLWGSTIVGIAVVILFKARRHGIGRPGWKPVIAWCHLLLALLFLLPTLPLADWFRANSTQIQPLGGWYGPTLLVTAALLVGVYRKTRRHLFLLAIVLASAWTIGAAYAAPKNAAVGLPFLALAAALLAGADRKLLAVLGWLLVLAGMATVPGIEFEKLLLYGLSGSAVLTLMLMLQKLARPAARSWPSASTSHPHPEEVTEPQERAVSGWLVPIAFAVALLAAASLLGWSPAGNTTAIQVSLLVAALAGAVAYIGLFEWAEHRQMTRFREEFAQLQGVLDASRTAYALWRRDGSFLWCNRANLDLFGGRLDQYRALTLDSMAIFRNVSGKASADAIIRGGKLQVDYAGASTFGKLVDVRVRFSGVMINCRALVFGEAFDLSEEHARMRESEERLQAANEARMQAEAQRLAGIRKDEFLAAVSHELRTPLNGILGMLQALEREPLADKPRGLVRNAQRASRLLLGQVSDILDFTRLREGRLELHQTTVALGDVFATLRAVMQPLADERGLELHFECESCAAQFVQMDGQRFAQILTNLLSNAVKFTERGSVTLSASCEPAPQGTLGLCIRVVDTGIGMTPQFLPLLFDRFTQAGPQDGSKPGAGLGMAITRQLVQRMGGRIEVESEQGKGTRFTVHLAPVLASAEQVRSLLENENENENESQSLSGLRVLYAEDDPLNRLVVGVLLEDTGVVLETVENGQQAVDRLLGGGERIDVVLMDLQMPVLDGNAATERIRAQHTPETLPIIGLSAHALESQEQHARQVGMTGFLSKPVLRADLVRALTQAAGERVRAARPMRPDVVSDQVLAPPMAPERSVPAQAAVIDAERMQKQMGASLGKVRQLLGLFFELIPGLIDEIAQCIAQGDHVQTARKAHLLKGRISMVAAEPMLACCEALDRAAKAQDAGAQQEALAQIRAQYPGLEDALRQWLAQQGS